MVLIFGPDRFAVMSTILLIYVSSTVAEQLKCHFENHIYIPYWPNVTLCMVKRHPFVTRDRAQHYTFSGSLRNKSEVTAVMFLESKTVEFLPTEIFTEFPNLTGLLVEKNRMPVVKNRIFNKHFTGLDHLSLNRNQIQEIEENAFIGLHELRKIELSQNEIEFLKYEIFQYSPKLKFITLDSNLIKLINPRMFTTLRHLKTIIMFGNTCVNENICGACSYEIDELDTVISQCKINCDEDPDCRALWKN